MASSEITNRHRKYLGRFKKQREKFDFFAHDSDLQRLRRTEKAYYGLLIFFLCTAARVILGELIPFSWSYQSFLSLAIICYVFYIFYDLYWVSKSVDVMVSRCTKDISELLGIATEEATITHP